MRDTERAASGRHHCLDHFGSKTEKATFYGTIVGDRQVWPAASIAAWLHETALRLFPVSLYAKAAARRS